MGGEQSAILCSAFPAVTATTVTIVVPCEAGVTMHYIYNEVGTYWAFG